MTTTEPGTEADPSLTDVLPRVHITADHLVIGEIALPHRYIEAHGIVVRPGGLDDVNTVTVTFLVGAIDIDDPTV